MADRVECEGQHSPDSSACLAKATIVAISSTPIFGSSSILSSSRASATTWLLGLCSEAICPPLSFRSIGGKEPAQGESSILLGSSRIHA